MHSHSPRQSTPRLPALSWLVALVVAVFAIPASAQTQTNTQATQRAINFLSADVATWTTDHNCVACHRQGAVVYGMANAKANGYDMNFVAANGRTNQQNLDFLAGRIRTDQLANGSWLHAGSAFRNEKTSYSVFGLAGYDQYVSTQYSAALVAAANWAVLTQEVSTGRWMSDHEGFPVDHGSVPTTARIMTGLAQAKQRVDPARAAQYQAALDRAAAYLRANINNPDSSGTGNGMPYTFQVAWAMLGLKAAGPGPNDANDATLGQLADRLIARGSTVGVPGWGNLANEAANDFATGSAIYGLCLAGREPATEPRLRNAIEWLKTRQSADGSWRTGAATFDIPTSFAALGLSCFGDFSVVVSVDGAARKMLNVGEPVTQQTTFTFNVKNHGYQADTYTLSVTGGLPGWSATVSQPTLFLASGEERPVTITVTAPAMLYPALTSEFTLVAASGGAPGVSGSARVNAYTPPLPPVTGQATTTSIQTPAANSRIVIGVGGTLSARVMVGGTPVVGPTHGVVTFYVAGVPVGADADADGDGVYSTPWVPAVDAWTVTGAQDYRAVYSGVERTAPLANLLGSLDSRTLIIDPFPHNTPLVTIGNPPAFTRETTLEVWGYVTPRSNSSINYAAFIVNGGAPISLTPGNGGLVFTTITLNEGPNIIQLTGRDTLGGVTTKQVNLTVDRVAPILTIETPTEGASIGTAIVTVRSSVQDQTPVRVETQWAHVSNLEFGNGTVTANVSMLTYGEQGILVRATDSAGNVTERGVRVWIDSGAPTLSTNFTDGQLFGPMANHQFNYSIYVQTVSATTVRINGGAPTLLPRGGGLVQATATVVPGVNTFNINVTSETGITSNITRRMHYDIQAPVATLLSPTAGSTVSGLITVRARVTDNYGPVNGLGVSRDMSSIRAGVLQADGTWAADIDTRELVDGTHTIDFWMEDSVRNFTIQSFTIHVDN